MMNAGPLKTIALAGWPHLDAAAMPAYDFFDDPQAQAGAHILLGGEERIEDALETALAQRQGHRLR